MNINKPNHLVMEAKNLIRILFLFSFSALLLLASCVKEGPMGLPGVDGVDGVNGKDGQNGKDGTASCLACHNKTTMALVETQHSGSVHGVGPNVAYAGKRSGCAACHSGEGFIASQSLGSMTLPADLPSAGSINCETCHTFHQTFDFAKDGADYALRTTSKVAMFKNSSIVLDMGTSNICVNCHQPRETAPSGTADIVVANNRFGPHYGPQSVVNEGLWGYHHPQGTTAIPAAGSHPHRKNASCTSCHMHDSTSPTAGGHSWEVGPEACKTCHSSITTKAAIDAAKADYYTLFNQLGEKLLAKGALRTTSTGGLEPNPGTYPVDVAGALFNYRMLYGDHSGGLHNPAYAKALLRNSIEALN